MVFLSILHERETIKPACMEGHFLGRGPCIKCQNCGYTSAIQSGIRAVNYISRVHKSWSRAQLNNRGNTGYHPFVFSPGPMLISFPKYLTDWEQYRHYRLNLRHCWTVFTNNALFLVSCYCASCSQTVILLTLQILYMFANRDEMWVGLGVGTGWNAMVMMTMMMSFDPKIQSSVTPPDNAWLITWLSAPPSTCQHEHFAIQ